MSSKRSASMIIGISMGLDTCLILGQVSHNLLYWKNRLPTDICGPGERLTRKQLTSRPDHPWPELWKSMGKHAKLKEKQKWSNEKLHLENGRKLRGIYFIDPEDKEIKETIKNARKKLETSVAPAMPCKIMKNCGSGVSDKNKTKLACILEADESTRLRMGNSVPNYHQDHIAGKGENSSQHYNLVHKFIPMPQTFKILAAKAAVDKEWEKIGENFGVEPDESQKQITFWFLSSGRNFFITGVILSASNLPWKTDSFQLERKAKEDDRLSSSHHSILSGLKKCTTTIDWKSNRDAL